MYIKDLQSGETRVYGTNHHDALVISADGKTLTYENLQNGDTSEFGYRFVTGEDGLIPKEDEVLIRHGADSYFNIGGFGIKELDEINKIADEYHENFVNWGTGQSAEAFHRIMKIIGRDKHEPKNI